MSSPYATSACWNEQMKARSFESSQDIYDSWSLVYDQEAETNGYVTHLPLTAAELCPKYVDNRPNTLVLDVGAGTATVEYNLRKGGFVGEIDVLDANMEMLYVAAKRELNLRNIICHAVDGPLPLRPNTYDVVFCVGSLLPNHCPPVTIEAMLEVTKPGGHLIISVRPTPCKDYDQQLKDKIEDMIKSDEMALVEKSSKSSTYDTGDAYVYVYRKK